MPSKVSLCSTFSIYFEFRLYNFFNLLSQQLGNKTGRGLESWEIFINNGSNNKLIEKEILHALDISLSVAYRIINVNQVG